MQARWAAGLWSVEKHMRNFVRVVVSAIAFLAAIALFFGYSIHRDYYQRVRALESFKYAKAVAASSGEYFSRHSSYPARIEDLGLGKPDSSYVGRIDFDRQTGQVEIRLAGNSLDEGVLIFRPSGAGNAFPVYDCRSVDVPTEFVPVECVPKGDESGEGAHNSVDRGG